MASCNMASAATGFVLSSSSSSTLTSNTNTSPNGIAFPLKNNINNSSRGIRRLVMRASEEAAPLAATTTTAQVKAAKPPPIRPKRGTKLRQCSSSRFISGWHQMEGNRSRRGSLNKVNALPDWPLMAVLVEHMEGQRDLITHKSVWHLNDETIKSVYTFYIMFTCWGCCFFGSTKDPYYDSEQYRKDGGDGTGHWVYEKQEDIEESARAELWREELIEEIEQKVGGLRELEEAGKEEELVK